MRVIKELKLGNIPDGYRRSCFNIVLRGYTASLHLECTRAGDAHRFALDRLGLRILIVSAAWNVCSALVLSSTN
jgi:hypothetical protein